jgi:hypothetical protein
VTKDAVEQAALLAARAEELRLEGRGAEAAAVCRQALDLHGDCLAAHLCLARVALPGEDFLGHLRRFHDWMHPRLYLEIGVDAGRTLGLARAPTRAIGVDPSPGAPADLDAETHLYAMESDVFFGTGVAEESLGSEPVDLAFIDGLHQFEQALRDFRNVERYAAAGSIILFHDCLPLDEATASRERRTGFWSGDVWKVIPCLKAVRPRLTVFVIATFPTGLGVLTDLDPSDRSLQDRWKEILELYRRLPFPSSRAEMEAVLEVVPNDPAVIEQRLRATAAGKALQRR